MRYSITTCICACFYTDLVNFLNNLKTELIPKSSERHKVLQTSNFTASWVTRPCLQLLTTKNTKMQHQNQSSIKQNDHSFGQCSSLKAALTLNTTVTAAHCPEVLWYDEVGAVCSREIQTYAQVQAQHITHTQPRSKSGGRSLGASEENWRVTGLRR